MAKARGFLGGTRTPEGAWPAKGSQRRLTFADLPHQKPSAGVYHRTNAPHVRHAAGVCTAFMVHAGPLPLPGELPLWCWETAFIRPQDAILW